MTISATQPRELLPGYLATQRLGAGGYGEVWKVEAPGGLVKAVKLVYGFVGDERAERELKALHRIKEVRHPFVLSLERIEVIDGRLLIVTELADMSLMDRFEQCAAGKRAGIPRGELLTYLSDAADALDYMHQTHSLQHLDVKPENLLIVGGRAKVADFGLVKELADQTRSLVGAMTPTYAAPELFDGRASERCDQYSLAIVYQEMLTGALPFPGRTAAQLAAQHTQSPPQLAALPPAERTIVERALSKRPTDRYASCGEFVRALLAVGARPEPAPPRPTAEPATPAERPATPAKPATQCDHDTGSLNSDDTHRAASPDAPQVTEVMCARLSSRSINVAPKPTVERPRIKVGAEVVDAPPPNAPADVASEKTLLIGLGGTGMAVLGQLRRCLCERASPGERPPDARFLAFDTDRQTTRQAAALGMDPDDVVLLRLRPAHDYRADAEALLQWIGRRWLYNIPKSALTGGLRPLGRLALVDHAGIVVSKLRRRLSGLLKDRPENDVGGASRPSSAAGIGGQEKTQNLLPATPEGGVIEQSAAETSPPLRVIVVGACSGGTGGGMLLEMASAVRNVAAQLGRDDVDITLLVAHATNRGKTGKQLAQANAYSFLSELQHCVRYGSLSSETTAPQAAIYESHQWPVRDVYFHHLGDDLDGRQYSAGIAQIAEYLFADLATPLGGALRACRRHPAAAPDADHDVALRSMRMHLFPGLDGSVRAAIERYILSCVRSIWFANAGETSADRIQAAERASATAETSQTAPSNAWADHLDALGPSHVARRIRHQLARCLRPSGHGDSQRGVLPPDDPRGAQLATLCEQLGALKLEAGNDAPTLSELADAVSMHESNLDSRLDGAAAALAEEILDRCTSFLNPSEQEGELDAAPLWQVLLREVRKSTSTLLRELFPCAKQSADGQLRPDVQAMIDELSTGGNQFGCTRRTLVLRPAESGIDEELGRRLGRPCGIIDGATAAVTVCEERERVSLAQVAHSIVAETSEIRSVAARIHTRADIEWTEPALVECAS